MIVLSVVAFILLVFLPGSWLTFGLGLPETPFRLRLLAGATLSPLVVAGQFYVLRLLGADFGLASILLVILNLPVLYLIWRRRIGRPSVDRRAMAAAGVILAIIIVCIAPFLLDPQKLVYTWEAWSQGDVVYSLANGGLDLQDAELAGVRLSYPWAGHVYQAVQSYLLDAPPVTSYLWGNLVWLLLIFALTGEVVAELGGSRLARATSPLWLSFGVNFVGLVVGPAVPTSLVRAHPLLGTIWGDNRYSPWLDKVVFFGQDYFAFGCFAALVYLMVRAWPAASHRDYLVLATLLLLSVGIIYPVLLPAAVAVVGARAVVTLLRQVPGRPAVSYGEIVGLGAAVAIAAIVTFAEVKFLTQGRASATLIGLNDRGLMRSNALASIVVTSPLLVAFALYLGRFWRQTRHALLVLGLGAVASFFLYTVFDIPWWRNEYKFIFTAAICLAPFPSLVLDSFLDRLGRSTLPVVGLLGIVLAAPFAQHTYGETYVLYTRPGPLADVRHFDLRLSDRELLAPLTDAIRERTPVDALLVLQDDEVYYPTLTGRQLYVAPAQSAPHPGILITSDEMLTRVKGYPRQIVEDRRATVHDLFDSNNPAKMSQSLDQIRAFHRPLALVLDEQHQAGLIRWLTELRLGRSIYHDGGKDLWLIDARSDALALAVHR